MTSATSRPRNFNQKQLLFKELFVGTLIYCVVLGFFNDYTAIVSAKSFSTIFMASIVLEILTYIAFIIKSHLVETLKHRKGAIYKVLLFFSVWLVLFLSKFVFIWIIDRLFGSYITIHGFFGILFVVLSVTIIHKLADITFKKLGDQQVAPH